MTGGEPDPSIFALCQHRGGGSVDLRRHADECIDERRDRDRRLGDFIADEGAGKALAPLPAGYQDPCPKNEVSGL